MAGGVPSFTFIVVRHIQSILLVLQEIVEEGNNLLQVVDKEPGETVVAG